MIEVVTASHHHTDHMDPETLRLLVRVNPRLQLVCPESHRTLAHERSQLPSEAIHWMDAQGRTDIGVFTFHAVPAAHEELERDVGGWHVYLGFVVSFGPWSIYHSGDTVLYPGIEDWIRPFQVDLALLPINGRGPERRVAGNLWGREAAALALQIGAKCAIPCHYEMFEFNTASPDEFTAVCQRIGQPYRVLRAGERWTSRRLSLGTGLVQ
jgi:L-ascorbate metabolism protein UlaG (beta-lactamase superfamily)